MTTENRSMPPQDGQEQYRLLMENVKDYGIFLLDTEGRVVTWNAGAERILGYKEGEIVGQPFARIFTPEDVEQDQPELELRVAADKGRVEDERWHVRKDGTRFWASGVVTPLWDEDGTLRGFAKMLYGHEVWPVHTGPKALEVAQAEQPDVILLNIGLPRMDGYEVARHLREQQGMDKARLIAMTGYGQEADRQRSQGAGFDHHLVKPVDPARLQELLGTFCTPG
jgi:PAS domain S-box-containing protein